MSRGRKKKRRSGAQAKGATRPVSKKSKPPCGGGKKPSKPESALGSRLWLLPLGLGLLLALPLLWIVLQSPDNLPSPDISSAEEQVQTKVEESRVEVLAAPDDPASWGRYGMVLDAHGYDEAAIVCYEEASRLAPQEHRWVHLLATVLESRQPARALALAQRAIELDPSYEASHLLLARLYEQMGEPNHAKAQYQLVLSSRGSAEAMFGLGRLAYDAGDYQEAVPLLERARGAQPNAAPILSFLARAYRRAERRDEAADIAAKLEDATPSVFHNDPLLRLVAQESVSTLGYQQRAMEAIGRGDLPTASGLYEKLTEINPVDLDLVFNFASLRENMGDVPGAEAAYRKVLELDPDHVAAHLQLGIQLIRQERLPEARSALEDGLAIDEDEPNLHYTLGQVLVQLGEAAEARDHFERVLERTPDYGPAYLRLAELAHQAGELDLARQHASRAQGLGTQLSAELSELMPEPKP